jgi:excisionase family DNA binding protein
MEGGFDFGALLDALAKRVAVEVRLELQGNGTPLRPRLLTVEQAANYLGRTKDAVNHMIAAGKLPTVKSDRRRFVDVIDLDHWIEDNKQNGI